MCSKRELLPDERSVWDDYLDLAHLSPIRGKVCISNDIGYTKEQLSKILKTPPEIIVRAEGRMKELKMIVVNTSEVIEICNWKHYQSEYERQSQYRVTTKGYNKELHSKVTERIEENRIEENIIYNKHSIPPQREDVLKYCKERNNGVPIDDFIDHYTTNGWMRGKTKVKDWRACIRTWEKNHPAPQKQRGDI